MDMHEIEVDRGNFESLTHCHHKRGKNWTAILRGKNFTTSTREFLKRQGTRVTAGPLAIGDAVEFGADYVTSGGNRDRDRTYYVVREFTPDLLVLEQYETGAQAMRGRPVIPNIV